LKTVFSTHVENSRFSEIRQVNVSLNKPVSTNAEEAVNGEMHFATGADGSVEDHIAVRFLRVSFG
jgi:hypothetical protein